MSWRHCAIEGRHRIPSTWHDTQPEAGEMVAQLGPGSPQGPVPVSPGPCPCHVAAAQGPSDGRMTHRDSAAGVFPIRAVQVSTIRNAAQPECESLIGNIPQMHTRAPRKMPARERAGGREPPGWLPHEEASKARLQSRGLRGHFCQL